MPFEAKRSRIGSLARPRSTRKETEVYVGVHTHCSLSPSLRSTFSSPYRVLSVLHCGPEDARARMHAPTRRAGARRPACDGWTIGFASATVDIDIDIESKPRGG